MKAKDILFKQVTSIECWDDNKQFFQPLFDLIKMGHPKDIVMEMTSWPKSNCEPVHYSSILQCAANHNEYIVYYDYNYLLVANEDILVLYQKIN